MNMKKSILFLVFGVIISLLSVATANVGYDITNKDFSGTYKSGYTEPKSPNSSTSQLKDNYMYGDYNFPVAGVTEYGLIFLDISSCSYYIDNNVAYVSCLTYYGGGGSDGNGNFAKHTPKTFKFSTYKANGIRVIKFLSSVNPKTGQDSTADSYKWDNGFLKSLFWNASYYSELSQFLD